jgi:gliding motility-associated-like protein
MKKITCTLFLLLCVIIGTKASHIVGGEMSYECLGNNQYKIILKVYRDCQSINVNGQTTPFDQPAAITFFTGNNVLYETSPGMTSVDVSYNTALYPDEIDIDLSNPCLIPPSDVCVDQAVYETIVTLPFNSLGYYVSYQRCCRNNNINNIGNPGQTGATYTVYISDLGQTSCNSSPIFNNFPPVVICNNQPINFDHSATDAQSDQLVYSFCAPSVGASTGNPQPNNASAPPYGNVSFSAPFTAPAPLGPGITIDATTGLITGTPTTNGQFVVGVCVDELRNGVWISSTRRDFQFNVMDCTVSLFADIVEDSLTPSGTFLFDRCSDTVITFINQSGQSQFIDDYLWEFNLGPGNTFTSILEDPTVTFPGYGTYIGRLIVNPSSVGCTDTAEIITTLYENPNAAYTYTYDSCVIGPIVFDNNSTGSISPIVSHSWDFGDDSTMTIVDPVYQYQDAGTFNVQLEVTDANGCTGVTSQMITWAPTSIIDIIPSTASGCIPLEVLFENNSYPINGYDLFWTFGDGFTSTDSDPIHTYQDTGLFTVTVIITSPLGCFAIDTFPDLINVRNPPSSGFYAIYDSCAYGPVSFFETTQEGDAPIVEYEWDFQDGQFALDSNVIHQYDSAGTFLVTLAITDANDCVVEHTEQIDWYPAPIFQVGQPQFAGCEPFTVQIENTSYPINGYQLLWNLGDGYYSSDPSPTHTYEEVGLYDLNLSIVSPTGCYAEFDFNDLVNVLPNPEADFTFTPEEPSNFNPHVQFIDGSIDAVTWAWDFGDGDVSIEQSPLHTFSDTGLQVIKLVATHVSGCQDSTYKTLDVQPQFTYFLPNAFTPNNDGINDGYRGVGELFAVTDFQMQIWSRWGEMIFETNDPTDTWNGRINNTGEMVKNGVYVCVATLVGPRGEKYEYKTFATVVR